ncbi:MAG TPA: VPDSG-CTERM sorting domain-containing protein, partial [Terrimicrobiaceae bacterium]
VAAAVLSSMIAQAVPTNITVDAAGNLLNGGGVANGLPNNNPPSNLTFLNTEIALWNGVFSPDLPAAFGPVALNIESIGDTTTYNAVAGYDYVVFHFGKGQAKDGPWWQAWYLGGVGGTFNLPIADGNTVGGFSSARYFNPSTPSVPDGGSTVMLLGTTLGIVALVRRRLV